MAISGVSSVGSKTSGVSDGNPELPYNTIAGRVGVTRERVRQIARKNGYPPRVGIAENKPEKIC